MPKKVSAAGRARIRDREGEVLHTYYDSQGVLTGGVGHTGRMAPPKLTPGMTITKEMSDAWLEADLGPVEAALAAVLKVRVTQNQFDALASFLFNLGVGWTKASIFARLNAGDVAGAAEAFDLFHKPPEIIGRRNAEKAQFLTPDAAPIAGRATPSAATPIVEKTINPPDQPQQKGSIMEGFVFGLVKQQWQSVLRWGLTAAGTTLVARGTLTKDQVGNISPLVEGAIGALVALGSGTWSVISNKPSTIISTAESLRAKGH